MLNCLLVSLIKGWASCLFVGIVSFSALRDEFVQIQRQVEGLGFDVCVCVCWGGGNDNFMKAYILSVWNFLYSLWGCLLTFFFCSCVYVWASLTSTSGWLQICMWRVNVICYICWVFMLMMFRSCCCVVIVMGMVCVGQHFWDHNVDIC